MMHKAHAFVALGKFRIVRRVPGMNHNHVAPGAPLALGELVETSIKPDVVFVMRDDHREILGHAACLLLRAL